MIMNGGRSPPRPPRIATLAAIAIAAVQPRNGVSTPILLARMREQSRERFALTQSWRKATPQDRGCCHQMQHIQKNRLSLDRRRRSARPPDSRFRQERHSSDRRGGSRHMACPVSARLHERGRKAQADDQVGRSKVYQVRQIFSGREKEA